MTNGEIARIFGHYATMLEFEGANPFRVRAYREAARVILTQGEPLEGLAEPAGRLEGLPGIGKDLAGKIRDLIRTGSFAQFDALAAKYPLEVVALTELQGMGPKRVKTLFEVLGIRSRAALEQACRDGRLRELPGFGETIERNVLKALAVAEKYAGRRLLSEAWPVAHALADHVRGVSGVERVEIAGSFRRRCETIGDLDLLVCGGAVEPVMSAFVSHPSVVEVLGRGETKSSVRLGNGLQVDLRLVPPASFGAALLYFTGSKQHNIELRRVAIEQGLMLNEYGLLRGEQGVAARTEEEVYRALGMSWIPPELREAHGEIELATRGTLPVLIEERDLVADLHLHTDRTDGREPLETMVRAARDRGYRYCAITDHSQAITMARGFDEERVRRSVGEIDAVRKQVPGIDVLHGLEVDILADGTLDLDDEALALLDWVIVSLHSRLDQPAAAMTERVLRAISHPAVHAMAHPTARMIGAREPAAFEIEKVLARAAELGVAMEINGQPDRTDLSAVNARLARELGVGIVIDTDAHSVGQLGFMQYGVFTARRAGLTRNEVWNTLPLAEFRARLRNPARRPRSAAAPPKAAAATAAPARPATGKAARKPAPRGAAKPGRAKAPPGKPVRAKAPPAKPVRAKAPAAPARRARKTPKP